MKATNKYILVLLALVATTFTACTKEDNSVVSENKEVTLTTTLAPAPGISTKTIMNETSDGTISTSWEVGDFIWVKYINSSDSEVEAKATVTSVDGSGNATISVTMTDPKDASTITFGFPYDYWNEGIDLKTNQIGTLENIKTKYAASSGSGTLTVSGGVATLPTGVTMTPSVCIWKLSFKVGGSDITSSITKLSILLDVSGVAEKYVITPSSLSNIYVAISGNASPRYASIAAITASGAYMKEKSGVTLASGKMYTTEGLALEKAYYFSVSATKKVIFAPGNLQATYDATGQTWSWGFAAHQYDYLGTGSGNRNVSTSTKEATEPYAKLSASGTIDLFGRSTGNTYYGIATSTNNSDYNGAFVDWGGLDIRKNSTPPYTYYPKNYWRTLSEAEWQYVIGEGTYRHTGGTIQWMDGSTTYAVNNALCTKATVNGIRGLIIFPDHYSGNQPSGVAWQQNAISPGNMVYSGTTGWGATVTSAGWVNLENEGCVFLPAAGFRIGYYSSTYNVIANISGDYQGGYYMSTTGGRVLRFDNSGFDPNQGFGVDYYQPSVRLVHEID